MIQKNKSRVTDIANVDLKGCITGGTWGSVTKFETSGSRLISDSVFVPEELSAARRRGKMMGFFCDLPR